jgi:hypothetical protein
MLKKVIKILLPIFGVIFAFFILQDEFSRIDFSRLTINLPVFALSFVSLLVVFFMNGVGWFLINKRFGVASAVDETVFVWLSSSVARYIPGVVWGYANRIFFLKNKSVNSSAIGFSFIFEAAFLFGASVLIGINFLWFFNFREYFGWLNYELLLAVSILVVIVIFLIMKKKELLFSGLVSSGFIRVMPVFGYYVLLWVIFFGTFSIFSYSILSSIYELSTCLKIGLGFCLAFGLSFVLIVFPSGIGVREVIFFVLLSTIVDSGSAALLSVLSRVWIVGGELASLLVCLLWYLLVGKKKYKT